MQKMYLPSLLLDASTVVSGASGSGGSSSGGGMSPIMMIVFYCIVIFAVFYFFSIKPQRKKDKEQQDMRNSIKVGDSVLLSTGFYGKVVDVTAECYIIEFGTNKGIRIPVVKQSVYAVKEPNLTNKVEEEPVPEKKSLFGGFRKKEKATEEKTTEETDNK